MGPKKDTAKATARSNSAPKDPSLAKPEKSENPRRTKKTDPSKPEAVDPDRPKRAYKKRAKKQSLILSLQSSPAIRERSMEPDEVDDSAPLIQQIPNLKFESSRARRSPLIEAGRNGKYTFVEPELATPKPGLSGHTLETLPPLKAKRAAAAGKGRKYRPASSRSSVEPVSEEQMEEREKTYKKRLKTAESDALTGDSKLRSDVEKLSKKRARASSSSPVSTTIELPPTPKTKIGQNSPGSLSVKRIKIISPKRSNALIGSTAVAEIPEPNSDPNDNDDFCSTCGGTGVFICCDTCPKSFHLLCCDPPLRDVPEDNWNCNECRARLGLSFHRVWNDVGMFGPMINSVQGRNPAEFRLPKRLRNDTFIGVSTGDSHSYSDVSEKPELSYAKSNGAQIPGFNKDDSLDIDDLYDKEGNPYMCHKCGLSGLQHRTLAFCDYCPLSWHLDCLDVPMCSAKTRGQKWRCPNHVESLMPAFWTERRSFKDAFVLDAAAQNNFMRLSIANNFLVKHTGQPYLANPLKSRLEDYRRHENESFFSNDTENVDVFAREAESSPFPEDDTESGENVTPAFLQNYSLPDRIVAKASQDSARLLLMTSADDPDQKPFIYRVPEQQLVLDFLQKSKHKKRSILKDIRSYDHQARTEDQRDMEAVTALLGIQKVRESASGVNGISKGNEVLVSSSASDIPASELDELQQIRKLIQAKGKDALLQFLQS